MYRLGSWYLPWKFSTLIFACTQSRAGGCCCSEAHKSYLPWQWQQHFTSIPWKMQIQLIMKNFKSELKNSRWTLGKSKIASSDHQQYLQSSIFNTSSIGRTGTKAERERWSTMTKQCSWGLRAHLEHIAHGAARLGGEEHAGQDRLWIGGFILIRCLPGGETPNCSGRDGTPWIVGPHCLRQRLYKPTV